jgi:hypothetical protein
LEYLRRAPMAIKQLNPKFEARVRKQGELGSARQTPHPPLRRVWMEAVGSQNRCRGVGNIQSVLLVHHSPFAAFAIPCAPIITAVGVAAGDYRISRAEEKDQHRKLVREHKKELRGASKE